MNNLPKYIDWCFCLVMVPLMTLVFPVGRWVDDMPSYALLLIGIFYLSYILNRKVSVPMLFQGRRGFCCSVLILACSTTLIAALTTYAEGWPFYRLAHVYPDTDLGKIEMSQQRIWLAFIVVQLFSMTVGLLDELSRQRLHQQDIQHERDKAALALYRVHLNPHFLFNTLNSLYGLIVTRSPQAEEAFMAFTELNRTIAENYDKDSIPVECSRKFLQDYIDLQKLRIKPGISVEFTYESDDPEAQIAPMLLFTFVENALKHGTLATRPEKISFIYKVKEGMLTFESDNPLPATAKVRNNGTGLTTLLNGSNKR